MRSHGHGHVAARALPLGLSLTVMLCVSACSSPRAEVPTHAVDEPTSSEQDLEAQLETAAHFALAAHVRDVDAMLSVIESGGEREYAADLAATEGVALRLEEIQRVQLESSDARGTVTATYEYGAVGVVAMSQAGRVYASCLGQDVNEFWTVTFVQHGSEWSIDTINGRPAIVALLRMSPAGEECIANLELLNLATGSYRARSADYAAPQSLDELVPEHLAVLPVCPSHGKYSVDAEADVTCSVHGGESQ